MRLTREDCREIAERLDQLGLTRWAYDPADECPQGHSNWDFEMLHIWEAEIGAPCVFCGDNWMEEPMQDVTRDVDDVEKAWDTLMADPMAHPEWRIGKGEPKNFALLQNLFPALEAFAWSCRWSWDESYNGPDGLYVARMWSDDGHHNFLSLPSRDHEGLIQVWRKALQVETEGK